jgi:hypothetical protein
VALVALAAAFVYIYARIPQIAEMTLSFHATERSWWLDMFTGLGTLPRNYGASTELSENLDVVQM